jgi:hypothetical protein
MNDSNEPPRRYKWPWIVAAATVLGIILAVIWVAIAAKTVAQERDFNNNPQPPATGGTN